MAKLVGSAKQLENAFKIAAEAARAEKPAQRMSEALNPHVGKRLFVTQADRTALDYDQGLLGGPGFVELANIDPAKYKGIAWAVGKPGIAKTIVNSMAQHPEEAIWTNIIGSPTQHQSNQVVFDRLMNQFKDAIQEDKLTPQLHKTINKRLANMKDPKTGKAMFPKDVDILSPDFNEHAQTFHARGFIADVLSGEGIRKDMKALYDQPGTIIDYPKTIAETTDPYLLGANTGDIGDRLFSLSGNIEHRPELHPAFPAALGGRKESEAFMPAPSSVVLEDYIPTFHQNILEKNIRLGENKPLRDPTYYDLTRGYAPSVPVTDQMLERLFKAGHAKGGAIKGISKALQAAMDAAELPPAANSARTQIVGTMPTYEKARDVLGKEGIEGADIIDYGAGKGLGSTAMKAHSFEPYPQGWHPTYTKSADIPSDEYKGLLNLNVLNVLDPESRAHAVEEIGRVIRPEGTGLITTRGKDVMNTIGGRPGPEPMSVITSRETYQKGFHPDELREYIKHILGSDYEYEPLGLGAAGVKIKKKADGGAIEDDTRRIVADPSKYLVKEIDPVEYNQPPKRLNPILGAMEGYRKSGQFLKSLGTQTIDEAKEEAPRSMRDVSDIANDYIANYGGAPVDLVNMALQPIGLGSEKPFLGSEYIRGKMKDVGIHSGTERPLIGAATSFATPSGVAKAGAKAVKGYGNLIKEGIERNIEKIEPRMGIIKDPGGMLVGGEKALNEELVAMRRNERPSFAGEDLSRTTLSEMFEKRNAAPKDPNAVALNNWVDTKVRKYLRNQAGSENDPILKAIDSGVEHNFQPAMGDTKYSVKTKRFAIGKPEEGIAKTDLGKEFEYKVDSMFDPHSTVEIKDILNNPMEFADPATAERRRASLLRVEHNLPIDNEKDVEALRLINQIPDEYVHTLSGTNITERLGLNHVGDVLMEDLQSGRLKPEQLDQMSIEKAIRRTAEYDAQKAKEMAKAHATSVEGMPVPKEYDDGFKWVELKHETDPKKTKAALKSEGEMMGHCVGSYCPQVESGGTQIFSLRGPDNKSHVTIEVSKKSHLNSWLKANEEEINKDPLIKQMMYPNPDERYHQMYTEEELDEIYKNDIAKMLKMKGAPVHEPQDAWIDIVQVKGKQNKRPDEKYQKYVTDFVKNNVAKHEITDIRELGNTNLHDVQSMIAEGLVPKDVHFHPEITKTLKARYPAFNNLMSSDKEDMTYQLFKDIAKDFARKNQYYISNEDILNAAKAMRPPGKKTGGPINLETEFKLENMRRRYG